jgi:hypothetical protein
MDDREYDPTSEVPLEDSARADEHAELEAAAGTVLDALRRSDAPFAHACWTRFAQRLEIHFVDEERSLSGSSTSFSRSLRALFQEHNYLRQLSAKLGKEIEEQRAQVNDAEHLLDVLRAHARHEERVFAAANGE